MSETKKKSASSVKGKIIGIIVTVLLCAGIVVAGSFYVKAMRRNNADTVTNNAVTDAAGTTAAESVFEIPKITAAKPQTASTSAAVQNDDKTETNTEAVNVSAADISAINISGYTDNKGVHFEWTYENSAIEAYTLKIELGYGTNGYIPCATPSVSLRACSSDSDRAKEAIAAKITLVNKAKNEVGTKYITLENRKPVAGVTTRSDDDYDIGELFS